MTLPPTADAITELLDHMQQGVFTFDAALQVNATYSQYLMTLLGLTASPAGRTVADLLLDGTDLDQAAKKRLIFQLGVMFPASRDQWEMAALDLPAALTRRRGEDEQHLRLSFAPMFDEQGQLRRVLVILEDATELRRAELAAEEKRRELTRLSELLAVDDDVFQAFAAEAVALFGKCDRELMALRMGAGDAVTAALNALFRYVHTFKGNSRLFKLRSVQGRGAQGRGLPREHPEGWPRLRDSDGRRDRAAARDDPARARGIFRPARPRARPRQRRRGDERGRGSSAVAGVARSALVLDDAQRAARRAGHGAVALRPRDGATGRRQHGPQPAHRPLRRDAGGAGGGTSAKRYKRSSSTAISGTSRRTASRASTMLSSTACATPSTTASRPPPSAQPRERSRPACSA